MSYQNKECIDLKTNSFLDLNGIPYLVAEYADRRHFQQIDRGYIKSDIFVDQSESMRALIDISIDDIGKRGGDGLPAIVGNMTKLRKLINMVSNVSEQFNHQLSVLRPGLTMRVNYQVENYNTGEIIKTTCEDLKITDKTYFVEINPRDINDNAIITNYCNTLVSTMSEITSGGEKMVLRVTNVQMFYESLKSAPDTEISYIKPTINQLGVDTYPYNNGESFYQYHEQLQNRHVIGVDGCKCKNEDAALNPEWSMFNRFYHVDNYGRDFIIHENEVYDRMAKTVLIPCGTVSVNKRFVINPGHRIIFKFTVWKNDITIVNDATPIAKALNAQVFNNSCMGKPDRPHHHHHGHHDCDCDAENRELKKTIKNLWKYINGLKEIIDDLKEGNKPDDGSIPSTPLQPPIYTPPECDCNKEHDEINQKLADIEAELKNLKDENVDCDHTDIDNKIAAIEDSISKIKDDIKDISPDIIIDCGCGGDDCNHVRIEYVTEDEVEKMIQDIKNSL